MIDIFTAKRMVGKLGEHLIETERCTSLDDEGIRIVAAELGIQTAEEFAGARAADIEMALSPHEKNGKRIGLPRMKVIREALGA